MRSIVLISVFILLFSAVSNAISIANGETAPDFTLSTLDGDIVSLHDNRGSVVVLLYWRTGQKRSIMALKDNMDILKQFRGKEVKIYSLIAGGDSRDEVQKVVADNKIEFPVVVDADRQMYSSYGIRVYPTTVIVDREGVISHSIPSHPLSYKKLLKGYIKNTLGEIDEKELEEALSSQVDKQDEATLEARRLYKLALKFVQSGLIEMAINTDKKSISTKPELVDAHVLLGFLYLEIEDAEKAYHSFNRALELDPHSNDAKTGLGGALVMKGEVDKAIEVLNSAAATNPYPHMTYYELGKAYEIKGEKDKSIEMYKKAIEKIVKKQVLPSFVSKCD